MEMHFDKQQHDAEYMAAVIVIAVILVVVTDVAVEGGVLLVVEAVVEETSPQRTATSSQCTQLCVPQPLCEHEKRCSSCPLHLTLFSQITPRPTP